MPRYEHFSALGVSFFVLPSCRGLLGFERPLAFISPGGSEFLLIMLVLILLFGAKDAPRIFRRIHDALDKLQRAAASFRYKMMYGDIGSDITGDEPYDVEAEITDEEDDNRFHCELEDEEQEENQEAGNRSQEAAGSEPEPRNS